ncbi:hypothetical protein [Bacillus cihuensis]|uniref:hypothetical protein n=1 Tax=Bacillus cihuensis TaxID=1208599 RepID=UPI000417AAB9|nr:hypothetical protein [Bacillus cihuensis]
MEKIWLLAIVSMFTIILAACGSDQKANVPQKDDNKASSNTEAIADEEAPNKPVISQEAFYAEVFKEDI